MYYICLKPTDSAKKVAELRYRSDQTSKPGGRIEVILGDAVTENLTIDSKLTCKGIFDRLPCVAQEVNGGIIAFASHLDE
jgi:hypothetical protein